MKMPGKSLVLLYLAVATGSAAQGIGVTPFAPSAVNDASPLTQPLAGTLFFGQQQRDQMDRARKFGAITVTGVSGEPAPSVLNGFVKRSDGQSAIWVDGQPRYNVQSDGVRRLQPQDVGGENERLKVLLNGTEPPAAKSPSDKATATPKTKAKRQNRSISKTDKH